MKRFSAGLIAAIPIASGYVPVAITFGLLARTTGLTTIDAIATSVVVFAGAAQFLAIGMYGAGLPFAQVVLAGFLLNIRHLLMSAVVAQRLDSRNALARSILAFGVTDEVFGVASWQVNNDGTLAPAFLAGLEVGSYAAWIAGTVAGAVAGDVLPPNLRIAMGLALYALFTALVAGQIKSAATTSVPHVMRVSLAVIFSIGINSALRLGFAIDAGVAFPIAMLGGVVPAFFFRGVPRGRRIQKGPNE